MHIIRVSLVCSVFSRLPPPTPRPFCSAKNIPSRRKPPSSTTDTRYGLTHWYTNTSAGGKLRDMQYAWAVFNTLCAIYGVWVYLLWNEAVVGVHRDRRVFRQKVTQHFAYSELRVVRRAYVTWCTVSFFCRASHLRHQLALCCFVVAAGDQCAITSSWCILYASMFWLGIRCWNSKESWRRSYVQLIWEEEVERPLLLIEPYL